MAVSKLKKAHKNSDSVESIQHIQNENINIFDDFTEDSDNFDTDSEILKQQLNKSKKEKKPKKPITQTSRKRLIGIVVATGVLALSGGVYYFAFYTPPAIQTPVEQTGRYVLSNYLSSLKDYDIDKLQDYFSEDSKSWVGMEDKYTNDKEIRIKFLKCIFDYTDFKYPQIQAENKRGLMFDKNKNPVYIDSDMIDNEEVEVEYIDYEALQDIMWNDKEKIAKRVADKGYKSDDYTYKDEMTDMFIDYLTSLETLPTKTSKIKIKVKNKPITSTDEKGKVTSTDHYIIEDDSELDKILFSSSYFHNILDTYSKVATGYTRSQVKEKTNPEYEKYLKSVADGTVDKSTSKEPPKTIQEDIVGDEETYVAESVVPYTWVGAYFCQNEYTGGIVEPQMGDGTIKKPASLGTTIVTKAVDIYGTAHDVKITLNKYYKGKEAIDYVLDFSEKNRGFDEKANLQLICYEYTIENLSNDTIILDDDMCLSDSNANQSAKTGTIFGLTERVTVEPYGKKDLQGWASSTELDKKYLIWGKSFNRKFDVVWFNLLAYTADTTKSDEEPTNEDSTSTTSTESNESN